MELKAVVNEIEGLNESLRNLKNADLIAQSNSKRAAILKSLEAMSSERLAKRQSDLDADKAEKVAEALQVQKLDPVPIPQTEALPSKSVASVLTLPEKVFLPGKNTEAALAGVSARNRLLESSRQQRELLLVEIRRDTEQATEQAALRHGWKLVESYRKGASDATEEMKALLREQWRRTP